MVDPSFDNSNEEDAIARIPSRLNHQGNNNNNLETRAFGFPAKFFLGAQIFSSSTKYTFITSTFTSTSVITCIVSASFYGGSTQACRRKRSIADIEAHENRVNPSAVQRYKQIPISIQSNVILVVDSAGHPRQLARQRDHVLRPRNC